MEQPQSIVFNGPTIWARKLRNKVLQTNRIKSSLLLLAKSSVASDTLPQMPALWSRHLQSEGGLLQHWHNSKPCFLQHQATFRYDTWCD